MRSFMRKMITQIIFYGLNLANSEGVQNWTYQLIENGEMKLLYCIPS